MTHEASQPAPQPSQELLPITPEAYEVAINTIYAVAQTSQAQAHEAGEADHKQKIAVGEALEGVLKGEHGIEAQTVLWETGAAWLRAERGEAVVSATQETAQYTRRAVYSAVDERGNQIPRTDELHSRLFGPYGAARSAGDELRHGGGTYSRNMQGTEESVQQYAWTRLVDDIRIQTVRALGHYDQLSTDHVSDASTFFGNGVTHSQEYVADLQQIGQQQQQVREDFAHGRQPDEKAVKDTAPLYELANIVSDAVREGDSRLLAERIKTIVNNAPTSATIKQAYEAVMTIADQVMGPGRSIINRFGEDSRMTLGRVSEDVNYQFNILSRQLFSSDIHLTSHFMLLESVSKNTLEQISLLAEMWSQNVAAAVQPLARKS